MEVREPELIAGIKPQQYRLRWLVAGLAGLICITFFPYLFGGMTMLPADLFDTMTAPFNTEYAPSQAQNHYVFDGLAQELPYKIETKKAFERGTLAYWNPHILGGYPEYAESLANNYDVFNILLLWFSPVDVIHWETVLELLLAGIGMLLLLRFIGVDPLVNLIFASAYMLNSMFISSAHYRCPIASFCWIPFVVLMLLRYFYTSQKQNILYASLFLALTFLGGNFQTSVFAAFIVAIIILFYPSSNLKYKFFGRVGILSFVGIVSFALSAIIWLPTLELLFQTIFRGGSLNSTNIYDAYTIKQRLLSLPLLIMFFFPEVLGNSQSYNLRKIAGVDIINFNGAIAFLPALFALWGCYSLWKNKTMRPFIIIALCGVLFPIATPLFSFVYHRFFIVSSFAFCVIGAVAFQSFIRNAIVRASFSAFFRWIKVTLGILFAALALVWAYIALNYTTVLSKFTQYVAPQVPGSAFGSGNESWMYGRIPKTLHYYSSFSPALWLPILGAIAIVIAIAYYQNNKITQRNLLLLLLVLTMMQLSVSARTWLPNIDTEKFPIYPKNPIVSFIQNDSSGSRFTVWRDASKDPYILASNASNIYGINDIHGYEVCSNRSMSLFHRFHNMSDSLDLRLLGLANLKYVIIGKRQITTSNLKPVFSADSMTIYENLRCKPRAYFAFKTKVAATEIDAASELLRSDFDGSEAVFTKEDAPNDLGEYSDGKNSIHFDRSENEEIRINTETQTKGILILTDTYYPGWKCSINGKPAPIYRVNHCMRGVIVDAGKSEIIFKFEPNIFMAGIGISSITALLLFGGILIFKKRQRNTI